MSVFEHPDFDDHQQVSFFTDPKAGLRAIVAIHTTSVLGTSGGGCRMVPYPSGEHALRDVLRLSKAMTFKLALAGLPAGGAKTVIIGDPAKDKTEALWRALGKAIHKMGGKYVIAEDVGTTADDMEMIAKETPYVMGRKAAGDTGPTTGYGVYVALRAAVKGALDREGLKGLRVAVMGVGAVGYHMCRHLHRDGAKLWVADVNEAAVDRAVQEFGATPVDTTEIHAMDVDVFAPCAMGSILNDETIPQLRCKVIAGGANNQLEDERKHGDELRRRGIVYTPDFVANMGGAIGAAHGAAGQDEAAANRACDKIADILDEVFARAKADDLAPHDAAVALAKEKLAAFGVG